MEYRYLGRTGIRVSPICLGTMTYGGATDEPDACDMLQTAVEAGLNFIDTANVYNHGESESIVGKAIAKLAPGTGHDGGTLLRGELWPAPLAVNLWRGHRLKCQSVIHMLAG